MIFTFPAIQQTSATLYRKGVVVPSVRGSAFFFFAVASSLAPSVARAYVYAEVQLSVAWWSPKLCKAPIERFSSAFSYLCRPIVGLALILPFLYAAWRPSYEYCDNAR